MKQIPRYSLASITTKDLNLLERRLNVKLKGFTDEDIYIRGIESLEKVEKSQNLVDLNN